MELPVFNRQGETVEKMNFDETCLGKFVNYALMHQAVLMYEANQRLGTHYTKNRSAVICRKGKPFRQKGTGNARMGYRGRVGSRGGAVAHGPKPRDYRVEMPAKARVAALKSALLGKLRDGEIIVVNELLSAPAPKTKEIASTIKALKIEKTFLLVTAKHDVNVYKSARNIASAEILPLSDLHAYAVLKPQRVVITKEALIALPQELN
jgi:large subunit ribosomal protein L4